MADFRKALIVLIAGALAAILVTTFFVSRFGPSGQYELSRVLLKPDILKQLNYNDWNPRINGQDRFIFDRIEFDGKPIDLTTYGKLYRILNGDKSSNERPLTGDLSKITIYVKTESPSSWQFLSKLIQQVEIAEDDYRVELHEDNKGLHWVYFHHDNVKELLQKML